MELIKLSRVDRTIILVMDDQIYHRVLERDEDEDDVYEEIQGKIDELKSGILDAAQYAAVKGYLRAIIGARPSPEYREEMEISERVSIETVELAKGKYDVQERIERAERISSINENLDHDLAGLVYLKGHSVPMPSDLVDAFMDASYNPESAYNPESLENFWKWAVLNPNAEARNDLFKWFMKGEFTITHEGMVVAYRRVDVRIREHMTLNSGNLLRVAGIKYVLGKRALRTILLGKKTIVMDHLIISVHLLVGLMGLVKL